MKLLFYFSIIIYKSTFFFLLFCNISREREKNYLTTKKRNDLNKKQHTNIYLNCYNSIEFSVIAC